ncbi:MAG TPA: hypothetical protein VHD34_05375, partial [Xanthobacteraceae bacterium]|nr:hypothetical protein [Xanthobacteraceae bacterium]
MKSVFDAAWCGKWKRARMAALPVVLVGAVLAGCSTSLPGGMFGNSESGPIQTQPQPGGFGGIQSQPLGGPTTRVGLILPLSAGGN